MVLSPTEMEESPPGPTSETFCPEDYSEISLSLVDLEGHYSGARVVKKGKLNGLYFRVPSDAGCVSGKTNHTLVNRRVKVIVALRGCAEMGKVILRKRQRLHLYRGLWTRASHRVIRRM